MSGRKLFAIDPEQRDTVPTGLKRSGVSGGNGIFDKYFNQALFEIQQDHVIGTAAQLALNDCTLKYQSSDQTLRDKDDNIVVLDDDDRVYIIGLDTLTNDFDLSAIDRLKVISDPSITLDNSSQDLIFGDDCFFDINVSDTGKVITGSGKYGFINRATTLAPESIPGIWKNLILIQNAGNPNIQTDIDADNIAIQNVNGETFRADAVNLTADITTSGANGLDTGSVAASTLYYIYVIYNPTTDTQAGLFSLSATTPTLPADYTFYEPIGKVLTDSGSLLLTPEVLADIDSNKRLEKSENLNDVASKAISRTNLDVYDKATAATKAGSETLTNKTISGDNNAINEVDSVKDQAGVAANGLKCKIINIGNWNMDTTGNIAVPHGLTLANIRSVNILIRNDQDSIYYAAGGSSSITNGEMQVWVRYITTTTVDILRLTSGQLDNGSFNDPSYNRGWVTIWYAA
jgi:hypothetical protein